MTTTYTAKGSSQYSLSIKATVFTAKGSAQYALTGHIAQEGTGSAQHMLNAYKQQVGKGNAQYALNAYKRQIGKGSAQYALTGWTKSIATGSAQYALTGHVVTTAKGNAQYTLPIYQTHQTTGSAQYRLNAYTVWNAAGNAQHALNAVQVLTATGSAQWLLDANEKFYAYAMNLATGAVSKYENFNYNSLSRSLGADSTGIHALTGATDNGAHITALVESGAIKLSKSSKLTSTDVAYIGMNGGQLKLTMTDEKTGANHYKIPATTQLETSKAKLGRGCEGRYWKLKLENVAGSEAAVDSIELEADELSRRV